ncbi:MAG: hypothetical protein H6862_03605 [Rhodospirillales bacterium]|nr:hypothetical protein [Rhodospirillales bacterium]
MEHAKNCGFLGRTLSGKIEEVFHHARTIAEHKKKVKGYFRYMANCLVPQDPNDEPASALLERLCTESAPANPKRKGGKAKE